jgi:DNA recombination protein RmuC
MVFVWVFVGGLLLGLALAWLAGLRGRTVSQQSTQAVLELLRAEEAKSAEREAQMLERLKASFGQLSHDTMAKTTEQLVQLNQERLEGKQTEGKKDLETQKSLIDAELKRVADELEQMKKSRTEQFAQLTTELKVASERSLALENQTKVLSETLGSNQARGAWGERMAEDILRSAGFVEEINYRKQDNQDGSRPDFTFLLPQGFVVNMDVKFPYKQFARVVESDDDEQRERHAKLFMGDVKARLKEVSGKAYIDPQNNTVDYVLLFIPNDQIYAFMHQRDRSLLDDALSSRIILCSPGTLFAVLAVIRQAMDSFRLQERSNALLGMIAGLRQEWEKYSGKINSLRKQYQTVGTTLDELVGPRHNKLGREFKRLDEIDVEDEPTVRLLAGGADDES